MQGKVLLRYHPFYNTILIPLAIAAMTLSVVVLSSSLGYHIGRTFDLIENIDYEGDLEAYVDQMALLRGVSPLVMLLIGLCAGIPLCLLLKRTVRRHSRVVAEGVAAARPSELGIRRSLRARKALWPFWLLLVLWIDVAIADYFLDADGFFVIILQGGLLTPLLLVYPESRRVYLEARKISAGDDRDADEPAATQLFGRREKIVLICLGLFAAALMVGASYMSWSIVEVGHDLESFFWEARKYKLEQR